MVDVLVLELAAALGCAVLGGALIAWWALDRRGTPPTERALDAHGSPLTGGPGLNPETVNGATRWE